MEWKVLHLHLSHGDRVPETHGLEQRRYGLSFPMVTEYPRPTA